MNRRIAAAILTLAVADTKTAFAHHSFAMFDNQKNVILEGTVKDFQWTNPHAWIHVVVMEQSGSSMEWTVECGSPNNLARNGWKRDSLKPGDKARFVIHPLKDGTPGGSLVSTSINGVELGDPREVNDRAPRN